MQVSLLRSRARKVLRPMGGCGLISPPVCSITAILVSRFLLELQEASKTVVRLDPDDPLHSSRDPFDEAPSFISSIGAFVNPAQSAPLDEDLEWDRGADAQPLAGDSTEDSAVVNQAHTVASSQLA